MIGTMNFIYWVGDVPTCTYSNKILGDAYMVDCDMSEINVIF